MLRSACTPAAVTRLQWRMSRKVNAGRLLAARSPSADTSLLWRSRVVSAVTHRLQPFARHVHAAREVEDG